MWQPKTLKARLVALVVIAALPIAVTMALMAMHMRTAALTDAKRGLLLIAKDFIQEQDQIKAAAHQTLRILSRIPAVTEGDAKACADALSRVVHGETLFYNFGVIDRDGNIRCSARQGGTAMNLGDRSYFQRALHTRNFATGDYQLGRVTNEPSMGFALPVAGNDGEMRAVLYVIVRLQKLFTHTAGLPGQVITLIEPGFKVMVRSPPDAMANTVIGTELHRAFAQSNDATSVESFGGLDSVRHINAVARIRTDGEVSGYVVVSMPESVVFASANRVLISGFLALLLAIGAMAAIMIIGVNTLVLKRAGALLAATRRLAAGELATRIAVVSDGNEFSALENAFNDMARSNELHFGKINQLNRVYALLSEIGSMIIQIRDRDKLLNEACRIAVDAGGYLAASVFWIDRGTSQSHIAAHSGAASEHFRSLVTNVTEPVLPSDGPVTKSLKTGRHVIEQGFEASASREWTQRVSQFGCRAIAAFPLVIAGKISGIIALHSSNPSAFDEAEKQLLLRLAADTALGLEHIEKDSRIVRLTRVQVMLTEINSAILRIREPGALAEKACDIAVKYGRYATAAIIMVDRDTSKSRLAGHAGVGRDHFEALQPEMVKTLGPVNTPLVRALRSGKPVVEQETVLSPASERKERMLKFGIQAVAAFPLTVEGQVAGVMVLWSSVPGAFDKEEVQLLQQLAEDTGLGLEHIEQQMHVYQLSNFDRLTELPNRLLFEDRAAQLFTRAARAQRVAAVLVVRVSRFLQINDRYGRAGVDHVILHVSDYLNGAVRPGDTVARLGDNEFGVLLADVSNVEDAAATASRIIASFPRAIAWQENTINTEGGMGIAIYPQDGTDVATLLRNAEVALNNMTLSPRNAIAFYSAELDKRVLDDHRMEVELAGAMERNEFSLVYQPIVRIADRSITGAEALLRWHNRILGQVSPALFVPAAERTGLIAGIGAWVLDTASAESLNLGQLVQDEFRMAVNVSVRQFRGPELMDQLRRILEATVPGARRPLLCIEITESELMENIDQLIPLLNELKVLRMALSIDDFGTGYSSLSYLRRLPVDILKIDISFVREIATSPDAKTLAGSIVALGHSLGLYIVAEGVETQAQLNVLAEMGCDAAQGYFFSRPVPAVEFEGLLRSGF
jgi:diguanylate cyclase (GGDEF)-like protein